MVLCLNQFKCKGVFKLQNINAIIVYGGEIMFTILLDYFFYKWEKKFFARIKRDANQLIKQANSLDAQTDAHRMEIKALESRL